MDSTVRVFVFIFALASVKDLSYMAPSKAHRLLCSLVNAWSRPRELPALPEPWLSL